MAEQLGRKTAIEGETVPSSANGSRPVAISYNTTPRLHTSLRASTSRPRSCSGDM